MEKSPRAEAATVLRRFVEIIIDPQAANGWQQNDSGQWSYYRNGEPVKGWLSENQKWYWLDKVTGVMFAGGWKQIDGTWYYFNEYGHRQKGWIKVSGTYYYLDENGKMASNTTLTIDSVKYTFSKSGACQNTPSSLSGMSDSYFDLPSRIEDAFAEGPPVQVTPTMRIVPILRPVLLHREVPTAPARQMVLRRAQPFRFLEAATAVPLPRRAGLPVRQALRITRQAAVPPAIPAMYQAASTATARLTPHRRHQAPTRQALRQIRPINGLTDLPPIRAIRFRRDRRRVLDGNKPYLQNI